MALMGSGQPISKWVTQRLNFVTAAISSSIEIISYRHKYTRKETNETIERRVVTKSRNWLRTGYFLFARALKGRHLCSEKYYKISQ